MQNKDIIYRTMQKEPEKRRREGGCEFKSDTNHREIEAILSPALRRVIGQEEWHLGDREYRDLSARHLFQKIEITNTKVLWLDFNKKSSIIEQITLPHFTNLQALYLGDNNIYSIEPLSHLDAAMLQKLYLNHNKITSIRSLRRVVTPKLLELNLNGNYVGEEKWMTQCHFPVATKLTLGYVSKKQKILEANWWAKAEIMDETIIQSSKIFILNFNRKVFRGLLSEREKNGNEPKNLFKTFQN